MAISGENGSQRGTLYATNHYLRHLCFRFFAPNATSIRSPVAITKAAAVPVDLTFVPKMELRTLESYETATEVISRACLEWQ